MAKPVLDSSGVVAGVGQRVAAGIAQHVRVDRKGEACAGINALDQPVDGVGRERAAALGGEHKRRIGELPAQLAQRFAPRRRARDARTKPISSWTL